MKKTYFILFALALFTYSNVIGKNVKPELILSFTTSTSEFLESLADIKIQPTGGYASDYQNGEEINKSFDGNMSTLYHSNWNPAQNPFPITLKYYFSGSYSIDYLVYHPRQDGGSNGNFKEFELYYTNEDNVETKLGDYDFQGSSTSSSIIFDQPLTDVKEVKFIVKSGMGDGTFGAFASCAEMDFYQKNDFGIDLSKYFTDDTYSELQAGITREKIIADKEMPVIFKQIALDLLSGNYSPYRVQEYEAYRPVNDLASELKLSTYNAYENPTGIWFEAGDEVIVFVPDTKGEAVSLTLKNWTTTSNSATFALKKGVNVLKPRFAGQTYINYYTSAYKTAKPLKIHIRGGQINGYFDRNKNTADEWKTILNDAVGDHLDILGNYTNLIFHIPSLKSNCPNDGMRLIEIYDQIIEMEYELMGFFKYTDRLPKNHMLGRNMPSGYMHADGIGAAFVNSTMSSIGNPDVIIKEDNSWGIAHEYGHVNQIRPGLRWIGTVECTNNVYSSYVQYILTSENSTFHLRLEHENCTYLQGGESLAGGRFNCHLYYGQIKGDNWLFQWGQDGSSDHFVKLVPLWQLNLYYKVAKGTDWEKPDWYADICEETRNTDDAYFSNGEHQINFMKRACKYTETDLTEFFEKAGMLKPVDRNIDDYGVDRLTITQAMCDEVKEYVAENGWEKPTAELGYISGNTVKMFEEKLPVGGGTQNPDMEINKGVVGTGSYKTVSHLYWQNAIAYETYAGDELVRAVIAGTGNKSMNTTRVPYPSGSTKIVAVAWNGERTTIYEQ